MSVQQTHEQRMLQISYRLLHEYSDNFSEQLIILEKVASLFGGFSIGDYWRIFEISASETVKMDEYTERICDAIKKSNIPVPLALAALAREPIPVSAQKKSGAFYTDYRLALLMADDCEPKLHQDSKIADIASGSGILLAALALKYKALFPDSFERWISSSVFAFDLSVNALRGVRIALSALTNNVYTICQMSQNWQVGDSLIDCCNNVSFDILIGNPPWGKTKLSLHSFVKQNGADHTYGADYVDCNLSCFDLEREKSLEYGKQLKQKYSLLGDTDPDLYMAFLQKALLCLKSGGHLSYLVPAGIIRSKGTESLRRYLLSNCRNVKFALFDNKANYFSIDTRFKFVFLSCDCVGESNGDLSDFIFTANGDSSSSRDKSDISFCTKELEKIRSDLTVPECRSEDEKHIFFKVFENGMNWSEKWKVSISREIDMTNDKPLFKKSSDGECVPVIEGRMVQQHRFGAKTYISGSGRSALWQPCAENALPQYYIPTTSLSKQLKMRIAKPRAGFCDIAGQTNERAMMSAIIPSNVVCGNKVPTITFENEQQLLFWIGVTNSFVYDWMIRRIISTTINYFLLFSIPVPNISLDSELAQKIISNTQKISELKKDFYTGRKMQQFRAEIDVAVAQAYGLDFEEIKIILEDFPLLDRKQPAINHEDHSSITKDLMLAKAEIAYSVKQGFAERVQSAEKFGAIAYIPTEMVGLCERGEL